MHFFVHIAFVPLLKQKFILTVKMSHTFAEVYIVQNKVHKKESKNKHIRLYHLEKGFLMFS